MHKLQRGSAPACLSHYQHGRDNWDVVCPNDKAKIWQALEAMQSQRCAYCEAAIAEGNRQIEHFVQKARDPRVTFKWDNLFGSCKRNDSCSSHAVVYGTSPKSLKTIVLPPADIIEKNFVI